MFVDVIDLAVTVCGRHHHSPLKTDKLEKSNKQSVICEGNPDMISQGYLDHTLATPAFQPLHCTLFEECWIAFTADSKLAAAEVHYDGHVQVGLNACSHHLN